MAEMVSGMREFAKTQVVARIACIGDWLELVGLKETGKWEMGNGKWEKVR